MISKACDDSKDVLEKKKSTYCLQWISVSIQGVFRALAVTAAPVEVKLSGPEPSWKSPTLHEKLPARHPDHG